VERAPKTEASLKDVPLDAQTAESLWAWKQLSPHLGPGDWVFASPHMKGRQPYWPGTLWSFYRKPAERQRRKSEGRTRTIAPCKSGGHDRRLHAGGRPAEARGANQFGQLVRKSGVSESNLPKRIKLDHEEKRWVDGSCLFCWRPRGI
jgi:hypothetical protein